MPRRPLLPPARLPIVIGGELRIYEVPALKGSAAEASSSPSTASEANSARAAALVRLAEAHRRTLQSALVRGAVFGRPRRWPSTDSLSSPVGPERAFLEATRLISSVLDRPRARANSPGSRLFRLESKAGRDPSARRSGEGYLVTSRRRASASSPAKSEAGSPTCSTRYGKPGAGSALAAYPGPRETPDNLTEAVAVFAATARAIVQPGLRQDVDAVAPRRCGSTLSTNTVEACCRPLFDAPDIWRTIR